MFANKLHNIAKFIVDNALKDDKGGKTYDFDYAATGVMDRATFDSLPVPEQWIVSKCHGLVESCTKDIEEYQLGQAGQKVYEFLRDDLADWYLEISKTRLYEGLGGDDVEVRAGAKRQHIACAPHHITHRYN